MDMLKIAKVTMEFSSDSPKSSELMESITTSFIPKLFNKNEDNSISLNIKSDNHYYQSTTLDKKITIELYEENDWSDYSSYKYYNSLSANQQIAILLRLLPTNTVKEIFKELSVEDVIIISSEISKCPKSSSQQNERIIKEFINEFFNNEEKNNEEKTKIKDEITKSDDMVKAFKEYVTKISITKIAECLTKWLKKDLNTFKSYYSDMKEKCLDTDQKIGILLMSLPIDVSAYILKEFDLEVATNINKAISRLPQTSENLRNEIIVEFTNEFLVNDENKEIYPKELFEKTYKEEPAKILESIKKWNSWEYDWD